MTHLTTRNGLTLAYTVAFLNAALALVEAFGVHLNHTQELSITAFVNAAVILAARVLHLPEKTATGGTVTITHVPVLTETPAHVTPEPVVVVPPPVA